MASGTGARGTIVCRHVLAFSKTKACTPGPARCSIMRHPTQRSILFRFPRHVATFPLHHNTSKRGASDRRQRRRPVSTYTEPCTLSSAALRSGAASGVDKS